MSTSLYFPTTKKALVWVKSSWDELCYIIGLSTQNFMMCLRFMLQGRLSVKHSLEQAAFIGVDALGIALILTLFTGMVIALQVAQELTKQGAGDYVGALVAVSILRELAPIMTAFAVIAMVGSAYAAELATMKIQKQVDALQVLHVHPIRYLILPRLVAAITTLPMMTMLTAMAGIVGGMVVSYFVADLNYNHFMESVWKQVESKDVWGALVKAAVFGGLISILSCTIGLNTSGGAREVGISTTRAVVWSFIAMAIADYVLTFLLFGADL